MRTTMQTGVLLLAGMAAVVALEDAECRAQQMGHQHEMMQRDMSHMHEMMSQMDRIMERVHRLSERMPAAEPVRPGEAPAQEDPVRQMSRSVMIMAVEMKSAIDACDRMARDPAMAKDPGTRQSVLRVHDDLMEMGRRMEGTLGVLEGLADGWDERKTETGAE